MKLDRLLGILTILLRNERVTAPYLADKFEVSRRTIGRDIDALCQAGIPVVTVQGGGGGISIADGYKLDKSVLTTDELSGIIAALRGIGSVSDAAQIERTLDKLGADAVLSLREPVIIDLASHHKGALTEKIGLLKHAIMTQTLIEFDYYYEKGQSRRRVEPYFIIFQWTAWYLFAYCLERQDWRLFKLARLWNIRDCGEAFVPHVIPPERRDFNAHLPDDQALVVLFDPTVRHQLIETYGPSCYTEEPDGRLRLEIGYTNKSYMTAWLLGFGEKVTVLEPREIAEDICAAARRIQSNYHFEEKA